MVRDPQPSPKNLAALNGLLRESPPMVKGGTRAVPGEGPLHPGIAFVGEQPGDQEDIAGRPFVGPAGRMLDKALAEATRRLEQDFTDSAYAEQQRLMSARKSYNDRLASLAGNE